jgi:hypothetical protein
MGRFLVMLALALASCDSVARDDSRAAPPAQAGAKPAAAADNCTFPRLDFSTVERLSADERAAFTANLRAAFDRACREGLFAERPLVDPRSYDRSLLYVMDAPANDTLLIYFGPSAAPPAMMASVPFGSPVRQPTVDELHEAIYCEVRGATRDEQVRDLRCEITRPNQ